MFEQLEILKKLATDLKKEKKDKKSPFFKKKFLSFTVCAFLIMGNKNFMKHNILLFGMIKAVASIAILAIFCCSNFWKKLVSISDYSNYENEKKYSAIQNTYGNVFTMEIYYAEFIKENFKKRIENFNKTI